MSRSEVFVVMTPDRVEDLAGLVGDSPVWIVRSEGNVRAAERLRATRAAANRPSDVTTFDRVEDTPESLRFLFETIDLHHGPWSSDPRWDALIVIGELPNTSSTNIEACFAERVEVTRFTGGMRIERRSNACGAAGTNSEARVRAAEPADIDAMHVVRCAVRENRLSRPDRVTADDYRVMLERDGRGWVAEVDGRIVGFAIADLRRSNVWALFVDPEHERRGIGRALHDRMMSWFLAQPGVERVWLTTDPATRAAAFYRAAGWRECGLDASGEQRFEYVRCAP